MYSWGKNSMQDHGGGLSFQSLESRQGKKEEHRIIRDQEHPGQIEMKILADLRYKLLEKNK